MSKSDMQRSKLLSLVLRHDPGKLGLTLDPQGWASVDAIVEATRGHPVALTREAIARVVANNDKKRFELSEDGALIRAVQGHSVEVDPGYQPSEPPEHLYHGTATRFLDSILREGLDRRTRRHVHLSSTVETAITVGKRHGKPAVLRVNALAMHARGQTFFLAKNGVWLTEAVAPDDLELMLR